MNTKSAKRALLFALAFMFLCVQITLAQQKVIRGKVTQGNNALPLPGVSVIVKGTDKGVSTDSEGAFSLAVNSNKVTLIFSSIGFSTKEVPVAADKEYIAVRLDQAASEAADEIVVIGYGSKSRKNLTGSIVKVNGDDIRNVPMASPDQLIQGKAAGVQIASQSGTPGGGVTVRVRGTSSFSPNTPASQPLYIIDGVFVNTTPLGPAGYGTEQQIANPLADINSSDIASIEILKDANATAIYGSRGANGVIIITTRRGSLNQKTRVNLNMYYGVAKATKLPELASGPQVAELLNEIWVNDGKNPTNKPYPNPSTVPTYDRIPLIFRSAPTANIDLNVSGGDSKTSFFIGGSVFKQDGIMRPQTFNRATVRINLDHQLNSKIKLSTSNTVIRNYRTVIANDNSFGVLLTGMGNASLYPTYNPDGTYFRGPVGNNVMAQINENDETSIGVRIISNAFVEFEVIPKLLFRTSWSVDFNDAMNRAFSSTVLNGPGQVASGYEANNRQTTWINEQTLRYAWDPGSDHQFNFLIGNTVQKTATKSFGVGASNFPNDDLRYLSSASQADFWSGGASESALASFFGRVDYSFKNKYIFDVNMRGDASSRFGLNNRWGFFPSAGFAWRIIQEQFMANQHIFSNLKLKASYGITGAQETISEYASKGLWGGNDNYLMQPGTQPNQIANPDLKWEQTSQVNLGVEFGLFNDRLSGEFNYYDKLTKGVLLNKPVPMTTGFSTIAYNGGDISNKGIELSLTAGIIRGKNLRWDMNFNIAHNKNLIKKLDVPYFEPFSRKFILFQQGFPVNGFWLWRQEKVDPQTGNSVYTDLDKNGVIDDNDRIILGSTQPDVLGGLSSTFRS